MRVCVCVQPAQVTATFTSADSVFNMQATTEVNVRDADTCQTCEATIDDPIVIIALPFVDQSNSQGYGVNAFVSCGGYGYARTDAHPGRSPFGMTTTTSRLEPTRAMRGGGGGGAHALLVALTPTLALTLATPTLTLTLTPNPNPNPCRSRHGWEGTRRSSGSARLRLRHSRRFLHELEDACLSTFSSSADSEPAAYGRRRRRRRAAS